MKNNYFGFELFLPVLKLKFSMKPTSNISIRKATSNFTAVLLLALLVVGFTPVKLKKDSYFINLFIRNKSLFDAHVNSVGDKKKINQLGGIADKLSDIGVASTFGPEIISPDITFYFKGGNDLVYKALVYVKNPSWLEVNAVSLNLDRIDLRKKGVHYRRIANHWFLELVINTE